MSTNAKQITRAQKKLDKYEKKINITKNKLSNLEDKSSKSIITAEKNKHKGVRDLVSGLTHCIGAGLSVVALVLLIVFASIKGNAYHVVTFTIFGVSLVLMYLFSTLYHWLNISDKGIRVFRKFDHIKFEQQNRKKEGINNLLFD